MRIVVTGSDGFIGRALCRELEDGPHETLGFDVSYTPHMDVSKESFKRFLDDEVMAGGVFDLVIHLAAEVGKLNCEQNPARAAEVNVVGTLNVAKACASYGVPLVYCSTSEVYGDNKSWVVAEDRSRGTGYGMSGMYALTKLWGEQVCQLYAPEGLKIVRPAMPYGPGVPPGPGRRALDNLIWQALTGQPMIVHRDAARSWCWIGDLARGIRYVIECGDPGIYNVGRDDDEISMEDLAMAILREIHGDEYGALTRWADLVEVVDAPPRQTAVKRISCAKLRELGWEPEVPLEEGLPVMVAWIQKWLAAVSA